MIFVTVGTQLAFDRMVAAVDAWAAKSRAEVFAQVGPTKLRIESIKYAAFLDPVDFDRYFHEATLVVAHAGMGSILTALSLGKPIIIVPRQAALGEHRNDHQMATARRFQFRAGVYVAWDEQELPGMLDRVTGIKDHVAERVPPYAPDDFIRQLREIINS